MTDLEDRVRVIEERNRRVEDDKAWEVSWARGIIIAVFTYIVSGIFVSAQHDPEPWLTALVPAVGFLLSTLSLPFFKRSWLKKFRK